MFRLLKLAAYGLIGYMIYQFFQGLNKSSGAMGERSRGEMAPGESDRSTRQGVGSMTGPGRGTRVHTEEASGTGATHIVGRGVV